jgi:hypothetical protein
MNTQKIIEEDGFGVFPEVLLPRETRRLIDDLNQSPLRVLPGTHTEGVLSDDAIHEFAEHIEPTDCLVRKVECSQ